MKPPPPILSWTAFQAAADFGEEDIKSHDDQLEVMASRPQVIEFIKDLVGRIQYMKFKEVNRIYEDPGKKPRHYCEGLREVVGFLETLIQEKK